MKIYDVVVNNDLTKCEQLYNVLLAANCQQLTNGVVYLRDAVEKREPRFIKYAYRISIEDNGVLFYYSYKDREEVNYGISLTNFIKTIKPERTVTL